MGEFSYGRAEKLKGKKVVAEIFDQPSTIKAFPLKAFYKVLDNQNEPGIKWGISVPKKRFKRAHDRNKIKRLIKEAYRLQNNQLKSTLTKEQKSLHILVVALFDEVPTFAQVNKKINELLSRFEKAVQTPSNAESTNE